MTPPLWGLSFARAMSKTAKNPDRTTQPDLWSGTANFPGAGDDDAMVRSLITDTIKRCAKKRLQIAEELGLAVGRQVSQAMLDAFTADSKENHRWPAAWTRAFCEVTADYRLLHAMAQRAGFQLITAKQVRLLELAERLIARETSERSLQAALSGVLDERVQS